MSGLQARYLQAIVIIALLAGVVPAISPSEQQQLDNFKVSTLKELAGVAVKVKVVRDTAETLPLLKEEKLQGEVEFALQDAGIEVLPPSPSAGLYVVIVKVAGGGPDNLICAIDVKSSLLQIVYLTRDTNIRTEAQTWPSVGQSRFGLVSIAIAKSTIERTVKEQVKDFAEDYFAANPKTIGNAVSEQ